MTSVGPCGTLHTCIHILVKKKILNLKKLVYYKIEIN